MADLPDGGDQPRRKPRRRPTRHRDKRKTRPPDDMHEEDTPDGDVLRRSKATAGHTTGRGRHRPRANAHESGNIEDQVHSHDRPQQKRTRSRGRGTKKSQSQSMRATNGSEGGHERQETISSQHDKRFKRSHTSAKRDMLSRSCLTHKEVQELSGADDQTVIRHIQQNESGYLTALQNVEHVQHTQTLKCLVKVLYKLVESKEGSTALSMLAQIFGTTSNDYSQFLFRIEKLIKAMPTEKREFVRKENLQTLFHFIKIGSFCIERIPSSVVTSFPIHAIKTTTENIMRFGTDDEKVPLHDMEQSVLELEEQFSTYEEELLKSKTVEKKELVHAVQDPPEHFTAVSILPACEEIYLFARKPFLRSNITKGEYQSWDHYLDVQFRLLREDFVGPLRVGISDYLENPTTRCGDIHAYHNVRIRQPVCLASEIGFEITFDSSRLFTVNWEQTKRFINGSLLCLSTDKFESVAFASVAQRETKQLQRGIVTVKFEGATNGFHLNPQAVYTMVESVAYYEAYRHVLNKLQAVSLGNEIMAMPFKQYMVDCNFQAIPLPPFLRCLQQASFDLRGIVEFKSKQINTKVDLSNLSSWPNASDTMLDDSQMESLKAALTQELCVIQGPPGTGKTYIGIKIVQSFLANRSVWDPRKASPILVVCYTNHALDQFLEGIRSAAVSGGTPNVTRIGGRCKTESLQNCTLYEKVSQAREQRIIPRATYKTYAEARTNMVSSKLDVICHLKAIHKSRNKILSMNDLFDFVSERHFLQLASIPMTAKPIEVWLGLRYITFDDKPTSTEELSQDQQQVAVARKPEDLEFVDVEDDDNEVQKLHDSRFVEGCEIEYSAPDVEKLTGIFQALSKEEENGGWKRVQMDKKKKQNLIRKRLSDGLRPMSTEQAKQTNDLWALQKNQRWRLYAHWRDKYIEHQRDLLDLLSESYKESCTVFQEKKKAMDAFVVQSSDVVGMTTTGAAKHNHIIKAIKPKIVVVEEAAEIFEPHIFTSLSPSTQQLILIGDHQQLRPKPAFYDLETKYNFNISLFERLALNGFPVQSLNIQHRMRPEIASLITPSVYDKLYNDESVEKYDHIQGVDKSLFFISHPHFEDSSNGESRSHSNRHEANFLVALCDYFIKQDYDQSQITILTLYRGQLLEIKKFLKQKNITGVRTAVVDDFQGEENDIILLSLVRSNPKQNIGFVGIKNRVCVALSRAKKGLYISGNLTMLRDKVTTIWPQVIAQLESLACVGETLLLHCHIHREQTVHAKSAEDFAKCSEGGCLKNCETRLTCGHVCRLACHPYDRNHLKYKCRQKCPKTLSCGHKCRRKCFECSTACKPCKEKVIKVLPGCEHEQLVYCSADLAAIQCTTPCSQILACGHFCQEKCSVECTQQCTVIVDKDLQCGHTIQNVCYLSSDIIICSVPCKSQLDCGHQCTGTCGTCQMGRLHIRCSSKCDRQLVCGHICDFPCTPNCPPCTKPCSNFCTHSYCPKKCFELCQSCTEECSWSCPHQKCTQLCGDTCDRLPCNESCPKRLKCGHQCIGLCGELCPKLCRICDKEEVTDIFLGREDEEDAKFVLLPDCDHIFEVRDMDKWMSIQSDDTATSQEVTVKGCPKCTTPVKRCLRYRKHIRETLKVVEKIKLQQLNALEAVDVRADFIRVTTSVASSSNSKLVAEELAMVEKSIEIRPKEREFVMFPYVIQTQLAILSEIVKVTDILSSLYQHSFQSRVETINRCLNSVKEFVMRDFLSKQQISDSEAEMRRLTLLAKLSEFLYKLGDRYRKLSNDEQESIETFTSQLEKGGWKTDKVTPEYEARVTSFITTISRKYNVLGLTETERLEIVKVMDLSKGHWFQCPNGHVYCIGECGGAMEKSKCPECKADIGGTQHTLVASNTLATQMDGARHPAWSEGANLENFDPEELDRL